MSSFTRFSAPLLIQHDPLASAVLGEDYWRVAKSFRYDIGFEGSQRWVTVPAGYLTDGASVPRIAWSIIPPWGSYGQAAVLHDLLCEYLTVIENGLPVPITRAEADAIFLEAMTVLKVPEETRELMSSAVNLYRKARRITAPTSSPAKRKLEAEWHELS